MTRAMYEKLKHVPAEKKAIAHLFKFLMLSSLLSLTACGGSEAKGGNTGNTVTNNLQCQGQFYSMSASVSGTRSFEAYNAVGDGYVRFSGTITTPVETAPMQYEDYSNLAPYEGTIQSVSAGTIAISVLDATGINGDRMIIYEDVPSLGPPTILGQLTCVWN